MYYDDAIAWATALGLALYFTERSIIFPIRANNGPELPLGTITNHIRIYLCPPFAAIFWYILSAFAVAANNCMSSFGAAPGGCYTSPTFASTTSSIFSGSAGIFYLPFFGLFWIMIVYWIAMSFYFAFRPIEKEMEKKTGQVSSS